MSPISIVAVAAAGIAVAVVAALQDNDPGRVSVRDALATVLPDGDARLTMSIDNDGGDDRIVGLVIPMAAEVGLAGADAAGTEAGGLAVPARSSITLDARTTSILARGIDWSLVEDDVLPLSLRLERSDAITVFVPIAPAE